MQHIKLLSYPVPLSVVCLGTAPMGSEGLAGEPADRAFSILDAYYALGGRFLDTANVYGRWGADRTNASELVIGRWIRERHVTDMTVTTKACHYMPDAPDISRVTEADMIRDVEESRRSLGMDTLDICLLHRDNEDTDIRRIVDFCVKLTDAGLIRRFGFSNYRAGRVQEAVEYLGKDWANCFVGVSNERSLAMDGAEGYAPPDGMQTIDGAMLNLQRKCGFPLFPFSSVAHGFFAKLQNCGAVYDGSWQNTEQFRGNKSWLTAKNGLACRKLCEMSAETGISVNMLSLTYLLAQPDTVPVVSVSRPEQLEELPKITERTWNINEFAL